MVNNIIRFTDSRKFVLVLLVISLLFNFVVGYVIAKKTDLIEKVFYKLGYVENPQMVSKRKIEFRCIQGWENTLYKMNVDADIVFFGNSITYESNFQQVFPDLKIVNMGCNKDIIDDLINRAFMIKSVHPKKIFVMGGINNFNATPLDEFKIKYETLVDSIRIYNPDANIFLQSILPVNPTKGVGKIYVDCVNKIKDANKIIEKISRNSNCTYIDLFSAYQVNDTLPQKYTRDGLHLYPKYYDIWADVIKPFVE